MHVMPAFGQVAAEFRAHDAAAAVCWINRNADIHNKANDNRNKSGYKTLAFFRFIVQECSIVRRRSVRNTCFRCFMRFMRFKEFSLRIGSVEDFSLQLISGNRRICAFLPNEIDDSLIIVGEQERIGVKLHDVAWPAEDLAVL